MLRITINRIAPMALVLAAVTVYLVSIRFPTPTYAAAVGKKTTVEWPAYNGGQAGDHYSPLTEINRSNVANLKVAWTFDTHEEGGLQTNPLMIGRMLFVYTPSQKVVALNAMSGSIVWTFDPGTPADSLRADSVTGVTERTAFYLPAH